MVSPFVIMPQLTVTVSAKGTELASQRLDRLASIELDSQEVREPVVGVFFTPKELSAPTPVIIVLGGSEGGYNPGWAKVLASKTRLPTLALAYFGLEGLPPSLENIPLETLEKAMDWLNARPFVAKNRFGVVGASRGGEMAILAASLFPQIRAVVGAAQFNGLNLVSGTADVNILSSLDRAPNGTVILWEDVGNAHAPAWTYRGTPFPFLHFLPDDHAEARFRQAQQTGTAYLNAPSFLHSLEVQRSRIPEATIHAERSQAAFLLIGNPGDGVWPSDVLSRITVDRLHTHAHPRPARVLSYEEGGHMLIPYPYYPTTLRQFYLPTLKVWKGLGGTAVGAAKAAEDSWPKVIEFLQRELVEEKASEAKPGS